MIKISREVRLGFFGIVTIAAFVVGVNFIKGRDIFHRHRTFYAVFDSSKGMQNTAPLSINGLMVGKVTGINFLNDHSNKILVQMSVYDHINIPSNSIARIISPDLLATRSVEIVFGDSKTLAQSGDTLKSEIQLSMGEEVGKQVAPIKAKAESLISSLDTMVNVLHSVFNVETRNNLIASFSSIHGTLANLEHASYNIDNLVAGQQKRMELIMANIESITSNIRQNDENISRILSNFANISDTLAKANLAGTLRNVDVVLSEVAKVTTKINKGEGTLGMLVNDKKLYDNLNKTTFQLNALVEDMKLHPFRYLNFSVFPPSKKRMELNQPAK